jgi:hypothetical protein
MHNIDEINSIDVARFQEMPIRFFGQYIDTRESLLDKLYGPWQNFIFQPQDCSDSPFRILYTGPEYKSDGWTDEQHGRSIIRESLIPYCDRQEWGRVAQIMTFFKVAEIELEDLIFEDYPDERVSGCIEFLRVFGFGCFRRDPTTNWQTAVEEWCHGNIAYNLFDLILSKQTRFPEDLFQVFLKHLERESLDTITMKCLFYDIDMNLKVMDSSYTPRVIAILAQKRFKFAQRPEDLMPYAYLMSVKLSIPKPVWNRQTHLLITSKEFQSETKTILLMRRFQFDNFPLHKDLVDVLLERLFQSHLRDLERRIQERDRRYAEAVKLTDGEQVNFCMDRGIVDESALKCGRLHLNLFEAIHMEMGVPMPLQQIAHRLYFRRKAICAKVCPAVYEMPGFTIEIYGDTLLTYCQDHHIRLSDVLNGRIKLEMDDEGVITYVVV